MHEIASREPQRIDGPVDGRHVMLNTLAVSGYRSLHSLVMPAWPLTVITGDNGSGKSNLYRALQLLADTASGNVISALARQGGLPSTLWAGPETISRAMQRGEVPIQGSPTRNTVRVRLGFAGSDFGYLIELGLPQPSSSAFALDPVIKRECIFAGSAWRQSACLVDRQNTTLKRRDGRRWQVISTHLPEHDSLFAHAGDNQAVPEVHVLRQQIRQWRFYSDFRTDAEAPARRVRIATRTPILHHDGRDLPAALQTILEVGDAEALHASIDDAFPGSRLVIDSHGDAMLGVSLQQPGLLRALRVDEWSDGTLRFILLLAALLTPRPPPLLVLNEPETSLHPDLYPPLARLIRRAACHSQVWVISHAPRLVNALDSDGDIACATDTDGRSVREIGALQLEKQLGQTRIAGLRALDEPLWRWT